MPDKTGIWLYIDEIGTVIVLETIYSPEHRGHLSARRLKEFNVVGFEPLYDMDLPVARWWRVP